MRTLKFEDMAKVDQLIWPHEPEALTLESPATLFFTDFEHVEPLVIDAKTKVDIARQMMLKAHVRLKMVVDTHNQFLGVISLNEINDQHINAHVSKSLSRADLTVADLMTSKNKLNGFDYDEVSRVSISEVIHHLKDHGQQHCLVVDRSTNKIRGIFSASDISRKLGLPINIQDTSNFYKVFSAIA